MNNFQFLPTWQRQAIGFIIGWIVIAGISSGSIAKSGVAGWLGASAYIAATGWLLLSGLPLLARRQREHRAAPAGFEIVLQNGSGVIAVNESDRTLFLCDRARREIVGGHCIDEVAIVPEYLIKSNSSGALAGGVLGAAVGGIPGAIAGGVLGGQSGQPRRQVKMLSLHVVLGSGEGFEFPIWRAGSWGLPLDEGDYRHRKVMKRASDLRHRLESLT